MMLRFGSFAKRLLTLWTTVRKKAGTQKRSKYKSGRSSSGPVFT